MVAMQEAHHIAFLPKRPDRRAVLDLCRVCVTPPSASPKRKRKKESLGHLSYQINDSAQNVPETTH